MPLYDYLYGTVDATSDELHGRSLSKQDEAVDVVHLTHLTTLQSIYHSRLGIASLAAEPYRQKLYLRLFWPFTYALALLTWIFGAAAFPVERNRLKKLRAETWVVPRFTFQVPSSLDRSTFKTIRFYNLYGLACSTTHQGARSRNYMA